MIATVFSMLCLCPYFAKISFMFLYEWDRKEKNEIDGKCLKSKISKDFGQDWLFFYGS